MRVGRGGGGGGGEGGGLQSQQIPYPNIYLILFFKLYLCKQCRVHVICVLYWSSTLFIGIGPTESRAYHVNA